MKPLGKVLQQADLISSEQIEIALKEQTKVTGLKLGEILVMHGWLKQETADFFSDKWPVLLEQKPKQPLGKYLKEAGLLNEQQIRTILAEQPYKKLRFGELAVLKGWLKPTTVNFFLEHLALESQLQQKEVSNNQNSTQIKQLHLKILVPHQNNFKISNLIENSAFAFNSAEQESATLTLFSPSTLELFKKLEEKASCLEALLAEVKIWTDGQPNLTEQICQLLVEWPDNIAAGAEAVIVQQVVHKNFINNWKTQITAEYLQGIRESIIYNQQCDTLSLLKLYREIWQEGELPINNSLEQAELLHIGLIVQQEDKLKVANRIYQAVFNCNWVNLELEKILSASSAKTTISPDNNWNVSNPITAPKSSLNKRFLALLGIAGLMVCGSGLIIFGLSVFRWLQVETIFKQGNGLLQQGQYQQAIAKYNNLLKFDSNYYQSWTNRGYALAGLKDYNQMLESCTTATIINPEAVYAWNCKGEALFNLKQYNQAISAFDKAIKLNSKDPVFWINQTEALLALNKPDAALTSINQAIELLKEISKVEQKNTNAKELAIAFSYQGKVLFRKQEYEGSLKAYEQALKYNPQYFVALRGKGMALQALKQDDRAIAQFYFILDHHKLSDAQKAEVWYYLGLSLCKFQQNEKAIAAFDEALKLKPNYQLPKQAKESCPNKIND
ncbi:MAG: tetratricopeptide repeat protein [Nostoc sp. ChiSLP01]|nr:tetratricopeptide repeat protein [Nostoc sp. CmiSLP01]MDZ8285318.1 tetratricopeptide repeat protein [Nostoc sp. ChiSLP01]